MANISLREVVGNGYDEYWNYKGRYRVCKGSRRSKKSKTTALNYIYLLMYYASLNLYPNLLVIRKTYRTLQDSCFAELKWAINRLQVSHLWNIKQSPLEIEYIPTGQKILFRGLDDPLKITSITVTKGSLCWLWIEEAYEITKEEDFNLVEESIIGGVEQGLYKQITLTFNPWNEHHWIKKRFFDNPDNQTLAITTNYLCNEWLDESDLRTFESMKHNNPRRYNVAGLGNWGVVDGLVFENWEEKQFDLEEVRNLRLIAGGDFGYSNDPTAIFIGFLNQEKKELYVWDEVYRIKMSNKDIADEIKKNKYQNVQFTFDSAEPKSIAELRTLGINAKPARKGKDSILNGIQWLQDLKIYVHPRCTNFITEISNYSWDEDKFGMKMSRPVDDFNHLMDAMRYAIEQYIVGSGWSFTSNSVIKI